MSKYALALVALGSAACTSAPADGRADVDPFYLLESIALEEPARHVAWTEGGVTGYTVRAYLRRGDATVTAPWITVYPGQRANVTVINQTTFIQDFDVEIVESKAIADPIVGVIQDGVTVELVVQPSDAPGLADIGFRVMVADLQTPIPLAHVHLLGDGPGGQLQLPRMAVAEAAGAARVELGTTTRVALLSLGGDKETVVLLRVEETPIGAPPEGEVADFVGPGGEGVDLAALAAGAAYGGRLRLDAVRLDGHLDAGVLGEDAARSLGLDAWPRLRRLEVLAAPRVGTIVSDLLQESYVANYDVQVLEEAGGVTYDPIVDTLELGLSGEIQDDGRLLLRWAGSPAMRTFSTEKVAGGPVVEMSVPEVRTHSRVVDLRPGRRVVPLARLRDGGTLAVVIDYAPAAGRPTSLRAAADRLLPTLAGAKR